MKEGSNDPSVVSEHDLPRTMVTLEGRGVTDGRDGNSYGNATRKVSTRIRWVIVLNPTIKSRRNQGGDNQDFSP